MGIQSFRRLSLAFLLLVFLSVVSTDVHAQLGHNSQEVWPGLEVFYRLNQRSRFLATLSGTKLDKTDYADGGLGFFYDHFTFPPKFAQKLLTHRNDSLPGKYLWLRMGYQFTNSSKQAENELSNHTIVTEVNSRTYLPGNFLGTLRNRMDWQFINGEFQARYRPRIIFERDFRTEYLFFTFRSFGEYFAYFGSPELNRFRVQFGAEIKVARNLDYEIYWNHQFKYDQDPEEVDAFGMNLKFYFTRGTKAIYWDKIFPNKSGN
jgi:hypothetical protein